jgi:DNA-binding PadR family transcriptional regulator
MDKEESFDEEATKKAFTKRLITNFLDIVVIAQFPNEQFSGYDILTFLQNHFDLKFSSGTVYSTLYAMERQNLIEGTKTENKRLFKVTKKGRQTAKVVTSFENTKIFLSAITGKQFG